MMRLVLRQFDGTRCVVETGWPADFLGEQSVEFGGATWVVRLTSDAVPDRPESSAYSLSVRVARGRAVACSVAVEWTFKQWSVENFVLIPAAVYNGNRFAVRHMKYAPMFTDPADITLNPPTLITDVPRLNIADGPSQLQLLSGDMATPAVGIWLAGAREGFWLLAGQGSTAGNHGFRVTETENRESAVLALEAPGVRDRNYRMMDTGAASDDRAPNWIEGQEVAFGFRVYTFPCPTIQALYDRFAVIRQDLSGAATLTPSIPRSASFALHAEVRERCWNPEGYYALAATPGSAHDDWQLGWVGGIIILQALLAEGNPESRRRAIENIDWLFRTTQAPSGLFHGVYSKGKLSGDGFGNPNTENWVMARKNADALYFLVKACLLLQANDAHWTLPATWRAGMLLNADRFSRIWEHYGQIGQFLDVLKGEIVVGGSAAAGILPAGLALAARYFNRPKYLATAEAIADHFVRDFVRTGYSTGGPGEILQCPDSESAFGMLESFVVLYEVTQKPRWLDHAREMAHQCMTWCHSYDFQFPAESCFGKLDMRTTGTVWANVQNKHDAPGICTLSGDSLFKLYRYTGDRAYLQLIREMAHNLPTYTSRADRPVVAWDGRTLPPGYMNERINTSEWEGKERVGGVFYGSCWCEVSDMLAYTELPSLYVQPDTGFVCALDHVVAVVEASESGRLTLRVSNPTKFEGVYKIFVEPSSGMGRILGTHAMCACPRLTLAPGESRSITVSADGATDLKTGDNADGRG